MNNFKYKITDVIHLLNLNIRKENTSSVDVDCPFCERNGRNGKGKLNADIYNDIYHCCKCGNGGGMIKMYADLKGLSYKESHREISRLLNVNSGSFKSITPVVPTNKVNSEKADDEKLNKVYTAFLTSCPIEPKHLTDLAKRGINHAKVYKMLYRSIPPISEHYRIINDMIDRGIDFNGVAGFYIDKNNHWNFNAFDKGFFIPVRNIRNQIIGLQIRLDDPKECGKYIWFSSKSKNMGVSSNSPVHFSCNISNGLHKHKAIYLTEGPLKSDIAFQYSGKAFMAIAGVSCQKDLPNIFKSLKEKGFEMIVDCFDMDFLSNLNVQKEREKIKEKVENAGLIYKKLEWDSGFKGIDDYLATIPKDEWTFYVS